MRITDVSKLKGPLGELNNQLFGNNGEEFLVALNLWLKKVVIKLLKFVTTVSAPAVSCFVACEVFGPNNPDGIRFYIWKGFKTNFLDKIEEDIPATSLAVYTLSQISPDGPIIDELGGSKAETTLAHLYQLVRGQANGQAGLLLTNGYANVFYVRDVEGKLRAVSVYWYSICREWYVRADSVAGPDGWDAGSQVVSQVSSSEN